MRSVGIDASEFSAPHHGGRLDVYRGGAGTAIAPGLSTGTAGDCTGSACPLWGTKANLEGVGVSTFRLGHMCGPYEPAASWLVPMPMKPSRRARARQAHDESVRESRGGPRP
jgi:hypothetical protein